MINPNFWIFNSFWTPGTDFPRNFSGKHGFSRRAGELRHEIGRPTTNHSVATTCASSGNSVRISAQNAANHFVIFGKGSETTEDEERDSRKFAARFREGQFSEMC